MIFTFSELYLRWTMGGCNDFSCNYLNPKKYIYLVFLLKSFAGLFSTKKIFFKSFILCVKIPKIHFKHKIWAWIPLNTPSTGSTWSVQSVFHDLTLPELTSLLNPSSKEFKGTVHICSRYQPFKKKWHVRLTALTFKPLQCYPPTKNETVKTT